MLIPNFEYQHCRRIRTNETGESAERMEGGLSDISVLSSRDWHEEDDA